MTYTVRFVNYPIDAHGTTVDDTYVFDSQQQFEDELQATPFPIEERQDSVWKDYGADTLIRLVPISY